MSYNDITKSNAYLLYAQGHSFRAIADMLRTHPGCERLTHNTIKSWAETKDENGLSWDDRKKEVTALMRKSESAVVVKTQQEIMETARTVLSGVIEEISTGGLKFKTKDAAIYGFKALAEWLERVVDKEKRISIEEQVEILWESMHEIPEVSEVLSKHEKALMDKWQSKALARLKKK
jgi:transposase